MSDRSGLASDVDALLADRAGWALQPSSTPGIDPLWCFGPATTTGTDIQLTVSVVASAVSVYVVERDEEFTVPDAVGLARWLVENEPLFAHRSRMDPGVFDELLGGRMAAWRDDGL